MKDPDVSGLKDQGSKDEIGAPYLWVEWSDNPAQETVGAIRYFKCSESAMAFAEKKHKKYRAIWIGEWAKYTSYTDNKQKLGEVYTWWSAAVESTEWGKRPDTGYGAVFNLKHHVSYIRIV